MAPFLSHSQTDTTEQVITFKISEKEQADPQVKVYKVVDGLTGLPVSNIGFSIFSEGQNISRIFGKTDQLGELYLSENAVSITCISRLYDAFSKNVEDLEETIILQPISYSIDPVDVTGYFEEAPALQTAPISTLRSADLERDAQHSLQNQLNTLPGVQMESRGMGGSRRLSIRGSFIRSPFAVRNIKMYLDGIPVTSPDGSSPFEMIDPFDLAEVSVVKGPVGGLYGSGNGGAMLFQLRQAVPNHLSISQGVTVGSFDFLRSSSSVAYAKNKWNVRASHVHQETQGYRDQEWNWKKQSLLTLQHQTTNQLNLGLVFMDYSGRWGLPGALKWDEVMEDPSQAVQVSQDLNAHVRRQRQMLALKGRYVSRSWTNESNIYFQQTGKTNPFGTSPFFNGFKDEEGNGYGGRTVFTLGETTFTAKLGAEFQVDDNQVEQFGNDFGRPGEFEYINDTRTTNVLAFMHLRYVMDLSNDVRLITEGGVSIQNLNFENVGVNQNNTSLDYNQDYTEVLPRLGVNVNFIDFAVYANYAAGNSPPSVFELVDVSNGILSANLRPEDAQNFEVGITSSNHSG
ncbi:MAG: TonB-dependent receptor plug domain-containing protein, partial [Bacteroidota bacterium]